MIALTNIITINLLVSQYVCNSAASLSVTIRVNGIRHSFVGLRICEESRDLVHDLVVIGSYEMNGTAGECLSLIHI